MIIPWFETAHLHRMNVGDVEENSTKLHTKYLPIFNKTLYSIWKRAFNQQDTMYCVNNYAIYFVIHLIYRSLNHWGDK